MLCKSSFSFLSWLQFVVVPILLLYLLLLERNLNLFLCSLLLCFVSKEQHTNTIVPTAYVNVTGLLCSISFSCQTVADLVV